MPEVTLAQRALRTDVAARIPAWPGSASLRVLLRMKPQLPPPSWRRAVESANWIAAIMLTLAIAGMAAEAFAR